MVNGKDQRPQFSCGQALLSRRLEGRFVPFDTAVKDRRARWLHQYPCENRRPLHDRSLSSNKEALEKKCASARPERVSRLSAQSR